MSSSKPECLTAGADTRDFPTLVVASAVTGIAFSKMNVTEIHACVEHLYGAPVFTHELIDKQIQAAYVAEAREQFPRLPTDAEARADLSLAINKALSYGETLPVKRGTSARTRGPIETLADVLKEPSDRAAKAPAVLPKGGNT